MRVQPADGVASYLSTCKSRQKQTREMPRVAAIRKIAKYSGQTIDIHYDKYKPAVSVVPTTNLADTMPAGG